MTKLLEVGYLFAALLGGSILSGLCMKYDWFKALKRSLDGGRTFRGKPLFGGNKTLRGVLAMAIGTAVMLAFQAGVLHRNPALADLELFDYGSVNGWLLGFTWGAAAMLSELPNSFVKRQLGVAPGAPATGPSAFLFYLVDQVDLLLGSWLVLMWFVPVTVTRVALSVVIVILVHQLITAVSYSLGIRATAR